MPKEKIIIDEVQVASSKTNGLLTQNKETITDAVKTVLKSVKDGYYDPLKALIFAAKLKEMGSQLDKAVRPIAEDKSKLSKGEVYSLYDVDVSTKMNGVKYDYSVCEDPTWNELKEKFDVAEKELKDREKFLQGITKPLDIVVNDAEVYTIKPPTKSGKEGLSLSIK